MSVFESGVGGYIISAEDAIDMAARASSDESFNTILDALPTLRRMCTSTNVVLRIVNFVWKDGTPSERAIFLPLIPRKRGSATCPEPGAKELQIRSWLVGSGAQTVEWVVTGDSRMTYLTSPSTMRK